MRLSEIKGTYTLKDDPTYHIRVDPEPNIILAVSVYADARTSTFDHPNIVRRAPKVLEFKHYRAKGSKFWTAHPGITFYFVVPKENIELIEEKGYSYVKTLIGGRKVTLNVSGGAGNGWTDYIGVIAGTHVGYPLRTLKAIAENSLNPEILATSGFEFHILETPYDVEDKKRERERFHRLLSEKIARKTIHEGSVIIVKGDKYTVERFKKGKKTLICRSEGGSLWRICNNVIDWVATAKSLGCEIAVPEDVFRVPVRKTT